MRQRIAITGIGAVTPIGTTVDGLWRGVRRGESAVTVVSRFDPSGFRSRLAAEVRDFDAREYLDAHRVGRLDRFSQFAVAAGLQAGVDAGLHIDERLAESAGCYIGSALGGVAFAATQHQAYLGAGAAAVDPGLALAVFGGAGSSMRAHGAHGPMPKSAATA